MRKIKEQMQCKICLTKFWSVYPSWQRLSYDNCPKCKSKHNINLTKNEKLTKDIQDNLIKELDRGVYLTKYWLDKCYRRYEK